MSPRRAQRLRDAGISPTEADLDARLLAQHVLGWTTERFLDRRRRTRSPPASRRATTRSSRAAPRREPLAYIVGTPASSGALDFEVTPAVLIPRPETELIVEVGARAVSRSRRRAVDRRRLHRLRLRRRRHRARTSGARASSPPTSRAPRWTSRARNAARHGVADRVTFVRGDLLDGIDGAVRRRSSSNPPYVVDGATGRRLQPEVRDHEPAVALFGGADGLDIVTRLVAGGAGAAPRRRLADLRVRLRSGRRDRGSLISDTRRRSNWSSCGATCRASRGPRSRSASVARGSSRATMSWTACSARSSTARSRRRSSTRTIACSPSTTSTRRRRRTCSWCRSATSRRSTSSPDDDAIVGEMVRRAAAIARSAGSTRRLPHRLQHEPRRRPDGVPHPPAPPRRPPHALAARLKRSALAWRVHQRGADAHAISRRNPTYVFGEPVSDPSAGSFTGD